MDLLRVTKVGPDYIVDDLIEGWDTLIWTERYAPHGEFVLTTEKVDETMALIQEDTLLTIRQSKEVMITETLSVAPNDQGVDVLTVNGRSFPTFFENRGLHDNALWNGGTLPWPISLFATPGGAVDYMLTRAISDDAEQPNDFVSGGSVPSGYMVIFDTTGSAGWPAQYFTLSEGDLYTWAQSVLKTYGLGIRSERPNGFQSYFSVEIYDGVDRTAEQDDDTPVILRLDAGHIKRPSYVFSKRGYKNVAYVNAPIGFKVVYAPGVDSTISGMDRRVLQVDANDLTDPGDDTVDGALTNRGLAELAKHQQVSIFDAEIGPNQPYKFKKHYDLGDKITVVADYGVSQTMIVSEYIRTQNAEGERGYPTLSRLEV